MKRCPNHRHGSIWIFLCAASFPYAFSFSEKTTVLGNLRLTKSLLPPAISRQNVHHRLLKSTKEKLEKRSFQCVAIKGCCNPSRESRHSNAGLVGINSLEKRYPVFVRRNETTLAVLLKRCFSQSPQ